MNFFVVQESHRFRVRRKHGAEFAYMFRPNPIVKVIREEFATRGGAEVFCEMLKKAQPFKSQYDIPGKTTFKVVPASELAY